VLEKIKEAGVENRGDTPANTEVLAPGVGSCYRNGWNKLWKFFLELLLIGVIYWVISLAFSAVTWTNKNPDAVIALNFIGVIYSLLVVSPIGYGVALAFLKAARGETPEVSDMFAAFSNYWNAVLAGLLAGVITAIGFVLLIVPGIIFACKLAFVPYLVVEWKMDAVTAVKESWRMTGGYALDIFLIGLLGIPIAIAGLICFGVGIIITSMWVTATMASLYHAVSLRRAPSPARPA
jgi:uncharacterized membrane protein